MKKKSDINKISILILILILVIAGTVGAFAGSSQGPTTTVGSLIEKNIDSDSGDEDSAGGPFYYNPYNSYVLAVYTGYESGKDCYKIAVTYKTPVSEENGDNVEITQVLNVLEGKVTDTYTAANAVMDASFRNGSRYNTYTRLWNDNSSEYGSEADGRYYGNDVNYHLADSLYYDWTKVLFGDNNDSVLSKYIGQNLINNVNNSMFQTCSTEYIRFQPEYPLEEIVKVVFISTGSSVDQWSLLGWDMYFVPEWEIIQGDKTKFAGPTINYTNYVNSQNAKFYGYVGPDMTNYSYLSDRLGLVLSSESNGIKHIARGAYDKDRIVGLSKSHGVVTFISPLANSYEGYLLDEKRASAGFIDNTFAITNDNQIYNASPKTLNFEIKLSEEYGAGISSYFTALDDASFDISNVTDVLNDKETDYTLIGYEEALAAINQLFKTSTPEGPSIDSDQRVFKECLYARINYNNTQGFEEEVEIPVVSNAILEAVLGSNESDLLVTSNAALKAVLSNNIASFCQEGQKLTFHVDFPDFKSLNYVRIKYINGVDPSDALQIHGITVYDDTCTSCRAGYYDLADDDYLNTVVPDDVTVLYRNTEDDYEILFEDSSTYIYYLASAESSTDITNNYNNTYLVTFNTTNVPLAATTDKIYAQFEYLSKQGGEKLTDEYDISEVCKSYYGYNPAIVSSTKNADGNEVYPSGDGIFTQKVLLRNGTTKDYICADGSYYYGVDQGGTISFFIKANDLTRFTGVKIRMASSSETEPVDEWQLDSIRIQSVETVSPRVINHIDGGVKLGNTILYNTFTRVVTGDILISKDNVFLFIQNEEPQEYKFEEERIYGNTDNERDMKDYYYSMSYDIATMNLGFGTISKSYEVKVNVAGKRDALTDDNSGSSNLYYFQLVFKDGKSAYVLANQQLEADGFRSGQTESFYIKTNEDYGDVTAVNIIPDDVTEDASKLDKLCISSIEVIKQNSNGVNKKYLINSVGWISPEYHDESNDDYIGGGRAVRDMVSSFSVSSSSYMLTLEIAISYDKYGTIAYSTVDNNGDVTVEEKKTPQFEGTMTADISYVNSNGELKKDRGVNIIEKMNSYDGIAPVTDASNDNITISNTKWMFRENTTDRFTINVEDISILKGITFTGNALYGTKLNVSGLSASIITSAGRRYITANNEYKYLYNEEPVLLVDKVVNRSFPEALFFAANLETSYTFNFNEEQATIPTFDEDTSLNTMISRTPESVNDTMNIFIYMKEGAVSPRDAGQDLTTSLAYSSTSTGKTYYHKITNYDESVKGGQTVLSVTGLSATNMTTLTNFSLKANSSYSKAWIDHAVVQQIRNDVMVKTYNVEFVTYDASTRLGVNMTLSNNVNKSKETQHVQVQLTDDTKTKFLSNEKYDLAASIYYTSTVGDTSKVYSSPYVFLTDSGATAVQAGQVCDFEFEESNINKIVGVKFAASNGLEVGTNRVSINSYVSTSEDGESELIASYSAEGNAVINGDGYKYDVVSSTSSGTRSYKLAKFTFKTMESSSVIDSKGVYPIRVTLNYKDINGIDKSEVIDDIRGIIDKNSSFAAGGTVSFSRLLKGIDVLASVKIEPYNESSSDLAMWNVESLTFSVENSSMSTESTVGIGKTVFEGSPKTIGAISSIMKLSVYNGEKKTDLFNEDANITLDGYGNISIVPEIIGTGDFTKYSYIIYADLDGTGFAKVASGKEKATGDIIRVQVQPNEEVSTIQKYKVVVSSDYLPELSYNVNIDVYGSTDAGNLKIEELDKMNVTVDYSLGANIGTVTNTSKTINQTSDAYSISLKTSTKNLVINKNLKYNRYEKLGDGDYVLMESKTISSGETVYFSGVENISNDEKLVKFEFISAEDSNYSSTVILSQAGVPRAVDMHLSYEHRGATGEVVNGTKQISSYGKGSIKVTGHVEGGKDNKFTYTLYVNKSDGKGYVQTSTASYTGTKEITVSIPENTGVTTYYKVVLASTENPNVGVAILELVQETVVQKLSYSIGALSGSVETSAVKTIDVYGQCNINLESLVQNNEKGQQFKLYVDEGSGFVLKDSKEINSSSTQQTKLTYNYGDNTSGKIKKYKIEVSSLEFPSLVRTLVINHRTAQISIGLKDNKGNDFTVTNGERTLSYNAYVNRTITCSFTGYNGNSEYLYKYYYDSGDGNERLICQEKKSSNYTITLTRYANIYGKDEKYRIEVSSVANPSLKATLRTTFTGKGGTTYQPTVIKNSYTVVENGVSQSFITANEGIKAKSSNSKNALKITAAVSIISNNSPSDLHITYKPDSSVTKTYTVDLKSGKTMTLTLNATDSTNGLYSYYMVYEGSLASPKKLYEPRFGTRLILLNN